MTMMIRMMVTVVVVVVVVVMMPSESNKYFKELIKISVGGWNWTQNPFIANTTMITTEPLGWRNSLLSKCPGFNHNPCL